LLLTTARRTSGGRFRVRDDRQFSNEQVHGLSLDLVSRFQQSDVDREILPCG
jgi:hypothetical protein